MISALHHESLNSLDLRVLAVQRTKAGRWWNFKNVISPFSRLWLVLGGRAEVRHHGRQFILRPRQLHLVPPFTLHDCFCSRQLDHYHLHFVSRLPTGLDLFSLLDFDHQMAAPPEFKGFFRRLELLYPDRKLPCFDPSREEYKQFPSRAENSPAGAVDDFEARAILGLMLTPFLKSARAHEGSHARVNQRFMAVQEFIHANMHRPVMLADLARAAELHPTYFSDQFKRVAGVRPLDYLMQRRMERAQYLLLTTRASVKEIAGKVGMADPAYFSRAFAKVCRVSPAAYRAAHSD